MFLTIVLFIAVLALIVLSHECGHFIVAKLSGTKVEEFGFGFPPRIAGITRGETTYSFNLFPLGGFVKLLGEDGAEKNEAGSFGARPVLVRAAIILAGVCMNIFLAFLLYSSLNVVGTPAVLDANSVAQAKDIRVQIADVAQDSPASEAGLMVGDTIQKVSTARDTERISNTEQVRAFIENNKGASVRMTILRGSQAQTITLVPRLNSPQGQGPTGIALVQTGIVSYSAPQAILQGARTTKDTLQAIGLGFWQMIRGVIASGSFAGTLTGPVGIARIFSQVQAQGILYVLEFTAFISLNIAILNVIPFPALDGGRLLFLAIEAVKGSPIPQKMEQAVNAAGFAFLILLMVLVTIHDLVPL